MTSSVLLVAKATLVLIMALGLDAALRKRHVLACAAMWEAVLVALLLLPFAAMSLSTFQLPSPQISLVNASSTRVAKPNPIEQSATDPASRDVGSESESVTESPKRKANAAQDGEVSHDPLTNRSSWAAIGQVIAVVYFAGIVACLIRLAVALVATARLRSAATFVDCPDWNESLQRWREKLCCVNVELRASIQVPVPLMVGYFHPTILIPQRMLADLDQRSRDAIIVHELGHVLRGDFGWQVIVRITQAVLWFHPLIWLAQRRIQFIRERACDDLAVHALGSSKEYIDILLAIAGKLIRRPSLGLGLAVMRTPKIAARLEATANSEGSPRCCLSLRGRLAIQAAIVVVVGTMAGVSVDAKQQEQAEKKPTPTVATNEARGTVTGEVVLSQNGKPVADATVLLRAGGLRREKTDIAGRFRFSDVPQGHYQIWAIKEPLVSPKQQLLDAEARANEKPLFLPVRLAMSPGKQIRVTVNSTVTGKAIEGARVELGYPDRQTRVTGQDGTAVLDGLLPQQYDMSIQAVGHAREIRELDLEIADNLTFASVSLVRGGTIRGTVWSEDQSPLVKADVSFRTAASPIGFYGESPYTDEHGRYSSLYLPLNTPIQISFGQKDYLGQRQEVTLTEQQRDLEFNVLLKKRPAGASVTGLVTDGAGKAIAGTSIVNFGHRFGENRETKSDESGRFTLRDVMKGFAGYELTVRASGFVPAIQKFEPADQDNSATISIKLERGHSVRGQVQNLSGEMIPGAYVEVNGGNLPGNLGEYLRTDRDGQFESNSLPLPSKFRISAAGYSTINEISLELDGDKPVVVRLEPAGAIRGQVVDASTGAAIEQFRVRFTFSTDIRPGDVRSSYSSSLNEPGTTFHAKDGTFAIHELTTGMPFKVVADAEGYEPTAVERVVAQPDAAAKPITIALRKKVPVIPASLSALSGVVLNADGKPVAGVQLRLIVSKTPSDGDNDNRFNWVLIDSGQLGGKDYVEQYLSSVTDAEGKFELRDILPGKFLQIAYWGAHAPKGRMLALAKTKPGITQSVTIQLPQLAEIRGSFDAKTFTNASKVTLGVQDEAFLNFDFAISKGQSNFEFKNVAPGKYWLSVVGQPERSRENPGAFTLRPVASRRLIIQPGEKLEIQLTSEDKIEGANK